MIAPRYTMIKRSVLFVFFLGLAFGVSAQTDILYLHNGDHLIGTLKKMEKGVASFKTDYSDSNFKVKWKEVDSVNTQTSYLIFVHPDKRYNGRLTQVDQRAVYLIHEGDTLHRVGLSDIVYLREVKSDFLSKFSAELGVGFNFTKAQRISEFNIRSRLAYRSEHWNASANYDDIRSTRKHAETVKRMEASIDYQYILKSNWFTLSQISLYSNSEQSINLRTLAQLGMGKLILMNRYLYWNVQGGFAYNNESFKTSSNGNFKNSSEILLGTEFNIYDLQDFSLLVKAAAFPSITESKRLRLDFSIDLKYDLPLDLFIKFGYTFNHDNKPIDQAHSTDYVFQTTLGWDFN